MCRVCELLQALDITHEKVKRPIFPQICELAEFIEEINVVNMLSTGMVLFIFLDRTPMHRLKWGGAGFALLFS
jgi:hypothetical protein